MTLNKPEIEGGVKRQCGLSAIKSFFVAALGVGDSGQGPQVELTKLGMMLTGGHPGRSIRRYHERTKSNGYQQI